ncbi:alpha/beta hydrolase [Cytobacillus sp. NCCP-133]|uniref:alpha/beta hydrolase n=1 Tax=Cytobacillus sp. NCCP-133 TaxID=766848 RepID=UPI002230D1F6|nr:alpha/beta hydrolase [Cytobacillus sp. NCCP-133]GLB59628.1 alpha/beta hydrolase [Cytobacillus sp. NCCP-133]
MIDQKNIARILERLADSDQKMNFRNPVSLSNDMKEYLNYYGFVLKDIDYHFGKIDMNGTKIMVQMFSPETPIGTVILLHGYLDHVGVLKNTIQHLNHYQYRVISYDLQGHGLSGGEAASVKSFSDYVETLEKLMSKTKQEIPGPFYGIGHSTGGAILINYVLTRRESHFKKMILVAPLVRSHHWYLSKIGFYLMKPVPFVKKVHRKFRDNSSDKQFTSFIKNDPLQPRAIPVEWVSSLIHWNKEIQTLNPATIETLVVQGTNDQTVDWEYNMDFIESKFSHTKVKLIKNGRHHLLNEKPIIRDQVFEEVVSFLSYECV